jgi:hypothetical protein
MLDAGGNYPRFQGIGTLWPVYQRRGAANTTARR